MCISSKKMVCGIHNVEQTEKSSLPSLRHNSIHRNTIKPNIFDKILRERKVIQQKISIRKFGREFSIHSSSLGYSLYLSSSNHTEIFRNSCRSFWICLFFSFFSRWWKSKICCYFSDYMFHSFWLFLALMMMTFYGGSELNLLYE